MIAVIAAALNSLATIIAHDLKDFCYVEAFY